MRIFIILPVMASLAGCAASRQDQMDQAAWDCQNYGAKYGSPEYTQCMMMKDQQVANSEMQRRSTMQGALANIAAQRPVQVEMPQRSAPRTCNSSVIGNQVQTNCY